VDAEQEARGQRKAAPRRISRVPSGGRTAESGVRILCAEEITHVPEAVAILSSVGKLDCRRAAYATLKKILPFYDVFIPSLSVRIDRSLLSCAKRLRLIAAPSTGLDHIDQKAARACGIMVISLQGEYELLKTISATAEHTFALLLALVRQIPSAAQDVLAGNWRRARFRGHELQGKTMGILGYGRVGEMVSRYARAFGMDVVGCDPHRRIPDRWVRQVSFRTLLRVSDVLSVHVPLREETKYLLGQEAFALMKPGTVIVNTSRGDVIDEVALLHALRTGRIAGAALDVLSGELSGAVRSSPLVRYARTHPNLLITPHVGGVTWESQRKVLIHIARRVREFVLREGRLRPGTGPASGGDQRPQRAKVGNDELDSIQ